jgi:alpha-amylase
MSLSNALHARGMYLMIDVVVNHVASETTEVDFSRYIPFDDSSYFHEEAYITNYDDPRQCEDGWLGDQKVPLPDLDTENPTVARTLHAWISALVQKFHIDGLRIDTVKHVNKDFWPGFVRAAGVWCVGEVLSGNPSYLSSYQPYVGGLLDYATYYPLKRAFKTGNASMYELTDTLKPSYRAQWADPQQLATFMENHDMPRFTRDTSNDQTVIMNALCWTMLTDGIPIIYYGQECLFTGQSPLPDDDQDSRQLMWSSGFQKGPLYKFIALLNRIRKVSWSTGFGSNLTIPLHTDVATCVIQKGPLILALSNQGSSAAPNKIQFPTLYPKDTILVDILTGQSLKVKGPISLTLISGQPQILLPRAIASQVISPQEILPSPMTPIDKFFSFFRSSSSPVSEISNWSTGAHVNTRDILLTSRVDVSNGKVLGPDPATFASPYSIFQSVSYSAFAVTTLGGDRNGSGTTLVTRQDPRGRLNLRTQGSQQSGRLPLVQKTSSYGNGNGLGVSAQQTNGSGRGRKGSVQKQQNTAGWNNYRDVSPAGSFTGQY